MTEPAWAFCGERGPCATCSAVDSSLAASSRTYQGPHILHMPNMDSWPLARFLDTCDRLIWIWGGLHRSLGEFVKPLTSFLFSPQVFPRRAAEAPGAGWASMVGSILDTDHPLTNLSRIHVEAPFAWSHPKSTTVHHLTVVSESSACPSSFQTDSPPLQLKRPYYLLPCLYPVACSSFMLLFSLPWAPSCSCKDTNTHACLWQGQMGVP